MEILLFQPLEVQRLLRPGLADLALQYRALKVFLRRPGGRRGQNARIAPGIEADQIGLIAEHMPLQFHRFETSRAESGQRRGKVSLDRPSVQRRVS